MKTFKHLLGNTLLVATKNNFVWFALTYWVYLETKSVLSTSIVGGVYLVVASLSGFWLGSLVDHYKKKSVMLWSSVVTLTLFIIGAVFYHSTPLEYFEVITNTHLWTFVSIVLLGSIAGNVFGIAVPALVTVLIPEGERDKANGLFGTVMGISFSITSFASGIALAYGGMFIVLLISIICTIIAIVHLLSIPIPEKEVIHLEKNTSKVDVKGTIKAIGAIPGLFALIFFTTFNNFLGGVFMALMDAYGLSLMSVQFWGILWGFLSFGFIFGGLYIAKKGLGKNPLKTLFLINIIIWSSCMIFPLQPSIILLSLGILTWMALVPFVEATEQTIIQKVVPQERQGRVFGFAHSVEQAASPLTAFLIGPLAQFVFIPFMTDGSGVKLIGNWFGVGTGRGIALVFIMAGLLGLIVTLIAMRSPSYKLLSERYSK